MNATAVFSTVFPSATEEVNRAVEPALQALRPPVGVSRDSVPVSFNRFEAEKTV